MGFLIQLHKVVCQDFTECTGFSKTCAHYSNNLRLNVLSCKSQQPACPAVPGYPEVCLGRGEMLRMSSLECLGSETQTSKDQLSLLVLCLGPIIISLMFQRCGKGKTWWTEEKGCKKEERTIKGKEMSPKTPDWPLVSLVSLGGTGCAKC